MPFFGLSEPAHFGVIYLLNTENSMPSIIVINVSAAKKFGNLFSLKSLMNPIWNG
jgi:hypothetical protein